MSDLPKEIIVCDIDGTIADLTHRLHYIKNPDGTKRSKPDWESFHNICAYDKPKKRVIHVLHDLYDVGRGVGWHGSRRTIYFMSGRNERVRQVTIDWLKKHVVSPSMMRHDGDPHLFMRSEGDRRDDVTVKREMFKKIGLIPDNVVAVLDDRQGVVDMWREEGFLCLQVDAWKEAPPKHHLSDYKLDDLTTEEVRWLIGQERERFNVQTDLMMNSLVDAERKIEELMEDRKKSTLYFEKRIKILKEQVALEKKIGILKEKNDGND